MIGTVMITKSFCNFWFQYVKNEIFDPKNEKNDENHGFSKKLFLTPDENDRYCDDYKVILQFLVPICQKQNFLT